MYGFRLRTPMSGVKGKFLGTRDKWQGPNAKGEEEAMRGSRHGKELDKEQG